MPGYGSWKELYETEYLQMSEEGYPVMGTAETPRAIQERLSGRGCEDGENNEAYWKSEYEKLWLIRGSGIRPDFPFSEPESLEEILAQASPVPELSPLSPAEYRDRVKGAWFGRCAGVVLGKPLEMCWDRHQVKSYLESAGSYPLQSWVPERSEKTNQGTRSDCRPSTLGNISYVQLDDDIHYTVSALLMAEEKGLDFTTLDVGMNMLENIPYHWFWTADRQAYYHLVNLAADKPLTEQVAAIPLKLNPWRECMVGFLRADFWGYITPSDPRRGAEYIYRVASLNLIKNGIYAGLFVQGCLSAALSQNPTVEKILGGGMSLIPYNSRLAYAVRDVCGWYETYKDFTAVSDLIYEKYGHWYFAGAINNIAFVTLALLHGGLDYGRTITTAVMCGSDTDCNSGTAGSIAAAAVGYNGLDDRWFIPLNDTVKTAVAGFGQGTITELAERTVRFYEEQKKGAYE